MDKIFFQLREFSVEFPDGFIISIGELSPIESGWVVSMKGSQNFEGEQGMVEAIEFAKKTTGAIGGWKDGDLVLWDVVSVFQDEDEATEAGLENEQLFIYQIETGRLKWLD